MNGSSAGSPPEYQPDTAVGRGISALRDVAERLRSPSDERTRSRPEPSGAREAVLAVLAEQPADGYRIVRVLQERTPGARTPGAGSVYPTLQLLADEGLATAAETDGRKTWTLTAAGHAAADAARSRPGPPSPGASRGSERRGSIVRSGAQLGQVVALAAQGATREQVAEIVAVLDDARRRILSVLARS